MATHALLPATLPANNDRDGFNLALARYAKASAAHTAPPATFSLAQDLAAGEALERAQAALEASPAPDLAALATKLRITLAGLSAAPATVTAILADVHRFAGAEGIA